MATKLIRRQMKFSRGAPVVVVRPSEHGRYDDGLCDVDGDRWLPRNPLADSLMGSCLVEVLLVLGDRPTKMLVSKDDHMVEDLSPCAVDKSLRDGVHVGGSHCGLDHPDSYTLAVAAYNAGPGAIVNHAIPQNGQTEFYVRRVMDAYAANRARKPPALASRS